MAVLDLDAERAARDEASDPLVVRLGGVDYTAEHEIPLRFDRLIREGELQAALALVFGDGPAGEIADQLTSPDLTALLRGMRDHALGATKAGAGEDAASS